MKLVSSNCPWFDSRNTVVYRCDRSSDVDGMNLSFLFNFPASTRKLYENILLKLPETQLLAELDLPEMQFNHNGSCESDLYSDKEEGMN